MSEEEICIGKRSGKTHNKIQEMAKEIVRLQKENEYLREREKYLEKRRSDIINKFQNEVTDTTIPKDIIRNKIKEIEEDADFQAIEVLYELLGE